MADLSKIRLSDGRDLAFCEYGDPKGRPIFFAHGGPGSRLAGRFFDESARRYGIRLIAADRPGMGQSTFLPNRKLLDYPQDTVELADSLGIGDFGVMGWSGGGAHTVICGYSIPDRLRVNIPLCGYTNFPELPGAVSMLRTKADRTSVALSQSHPRLFSLFFVFLALGLRHFPKSARKSMLSSLNETDGEIIQNDEFWDLLLADQREAVNHGGKGVSVDAMVHYVDWGIQLKEIRGKVHVFHGTDDRMVPFEYGRHLASEIPDAEFHVLEGEGHLFPWTHRDMLFELAEAEFVSA